MNGEAVRQAAQNNAIWCDTVCRTHGSPGEFQGTIWVNTSRVPRFYPNVITLGGADHAAAHRERVEELVRAGMPQRWSVKDSFQTLHLPPSGFRRLFDAQWIYTAAPAETETHPQVVRWEAVSTARELAAWEIARSGEPQGRGIFLPALLADRNVAVLAAYREGRIVAGAVASRAADVVGLSNIFVPEEEGRLLRRGCVAEAALRFPGLPLAGYEAEEELAEMLAVGFEAIGPLSVWLQTA